MGKELDRRAAKAELESLAAAGGPMGLTNLLPVVGGDFNQWGDKLNTFLLVSHNIDGTLKTTGSLPAGGTAGQVLGKLSDADGDYGFMSPALASTNVPTAPRGAGSPGISTKFMREDAYPPAAGAVQGNKIHIPPGMQGGEIAGALAAGFTTVAKGQTNLVPVVFTNDVTGILAVRVNVAGSSDCVVYGGMWNSHPTLPRAGTNIDFFSGANPAGSSYIGSPNPKSFQAGVTYWWGCWATGTTSPSINVMSLLEKVTMAGTPWNDNNAWNSTSWRYSAQTTAADLTNTTPLTGDAFVSIGCALISVS